LVCLGVLAALLAIFYAEEDWRGRRDWNRYRQDAEARGEHLDFRAYIPKPVPDEDNFAEAPMVKSLIEKDGSAILTNDLYSRALRSVLPSNTLNDRGLRHFEDLVAWQRAAVALQAGSLINDQNFATDKTDRVARAAAAAAVLDGMKPDEEAFTALRLASARPYARFPLPYDLENPAQIRLTHLDRVKQVCCRLSLQACAELADSQTDKALADVKLMLYLADSIKTEPFWISWSVRLACVQIAVQPVWEGLVEQRWTELQVQELQVRFEHYDFLTDMNQSLKGERAIGIQEVDLFKQWGLGTLDDLMDHDFTAWLSNDNRKWDRGFLDWVGRVMPAGWYDLERLNYCKIIDARMKGVMDLPNKRLFPSQVAFNNDAVQRQLPPGWWLGSWISILDHESIAVQLSNFQIRMPMKAAAAQTEANQADIACGLERYRLANGQFPETLDALTPRFIPHAPNDVITGQPYKYHRAGHGQYILYSVGWNEKDDGGVPGKTLFDQTQGDWVWDYP
jgi:hypothetical protein